MFRQAFPQVIIQTCSLELNMIPWTKTTSAMLVCATSTGPRDTISTKILWYIGVSSYCSKVVHIFIIKPPLWTKLYTFQKTFTEPEPKTESTVSTWLRNMYLWQLWGLFYNIWKFRRGFKRFLKSMITT